MRYYCQVSIILRVAQIYVKSGKKYLNGQTCKLYFDSIHDCKTFDISHVFLTINIAKLQKLKYPC